MESKAPAQSRLMKLKQKLKETSKISSQSSTNSKAAGSSSAGSATNPSVASKKSKIFKLAAAIRGLKAPKKPVPLQKKDGPSSASTSLPRGQAGPAKFSDSPKKFNALPKTSEQPEEAERKISRKRGCPFKEKSFPVKISASPINKDLRAKDANFNAVREKNLTSGVKNKNNSRAQLPNKLPASKENATSMKCESINKKSMTKIQNRNMFKRKPPDNLKNIKPELEKSKNRGLARIQNDKPQGETTKILDLPNNLNQFKHPTDSSTYKINKLGRMPLEKKEGIPLTELAGTPEKGTRIFAQAISSLQDNSMEWEPDKEEILRCARSEFHDDNEMMDWQEIISDKQMHSFDLKSSEEKTVYFVIDTNVLIRSISLIKKLITFPNLRGFSARVMIPWQVLKELDKLKTIRDNYVAANARKAARFLSENVTSNSRIVFQSQVLHLEDCYQVLIEVPDDYLIKCCCQLKNNNKNVILLSNDVNLGVKCQTISSLPAVDDIWLSSLLDREESENNVLQKHTFEKEPKLQLSSSGSNCPIFMNKVTIQLYDFLYNVINENYRNIYGILWPLWLPDNNLSLLEIFGKFNSLPVPDTSKNEFINNIWSYFKEKQAYDQITARDVDDFGRKCVLFSKTLNFCNSEIIIKFDSNMGFLKTGNIDENTFGYMLASITVAQNSFNKLEQEMKSFINYLEQLEAKVTSQSACIPDPNTILKKIDKHIVITNQATTVFLMLMDDEALPLRCPEIVIFHKVLLDFLKIVQDDNRLPLFSAEDISIFINHRRAELIPDAIRWFSDLRRRFAEFKVFLTSC